MSRKTRGQPKVLVVDDEPDLLELLEITLSRMGLDTSRAESVGEAMRLLDRDAYDLCLTDCNLPDGEGLRVVEHITQKALDVPVAVITAFGSRRERRRGAEGRRVRLPRQAGRARAIARARQAGAEGAGEAAARDQLPTARRIAGDAAGARDDRPAGEEPGAGVHQWRVGQRQGARSADDPPQGTARRTPVHRGELRRHPREPDGERVLRLPQGRVHGCRDRSRRFLPGGQRRHAVSRRSGGSAARDAGQAAARDPGEEGAQGRRQRRRMPSTRESSARRTRTCPHSSTTASSGRTSTIGCT